MISINDELKNNFFIYASCVNNERSFPDARDGLKPSQRAVLWEMFSKNYKSHKPHVKSAKVAGGVIASWWPHGDSSSYEALVRMSQPWVNNIPEIDFHGANGSLLGGPQAASSRYTECRLAKATEEGLFNAFDKDVVEMIPNFSDDDMWPKVLPALFPRLFINGSQGIGYTIAQEWEPGNLNEFEACVKEYLSTGSITYDNIFPDYPTGGIIINKKEISDIYKKGKGRVVLRGSAEVADNFIKITSLPYQVYAEPFIQKVKDLVNSGTLQGIEDIYNKSDDTGMLIEVECVENPDSVLTDLYRLTDLQAVFSANQMALVDGVPKLLTLKEYLDVYIEHNIDVIKKEYTFELKKASQRLEIVVGLMRAITLLDNIIKTIRSAKNSAEAVNDLKVKFSFTTLQAQAIVEMRLGKLANTEVETLNKEQAQLSKLISACNKLLGSEKAQKKEFLQRLSAFTTTYGWVRKTKVMDIDFAVEKAAASVNKIKIIENYIVAIDRAGNLKRIPASQYKASKKQDLITVEIAEDQKILLISNKGTLYKVPVKRIPKASLNSIGTPISSLVEMPEDEYIIQLLSGFETDEFVFFVTKRGLVKKTPYIEIKSLNRNRGISIMKVVSDDELVLCKVLTAEKIKVMYKGKEKTIDTEKFISKSRNAGGVIAIKTKDNFYVSVA